MQGNWRRSECWWNHFYLCTNTVGHGNVWTLTQFLALQRFTETHWNWARQWMWARMARVQLSFHGVSNVNGQTYKSMVRNNIVTTLLRNIFRHWLILQAQYGQQKIRLLSSSYWLVCCRKLFLPSNLLGCFAQYVFGRHPSVKSTVQSASLHLMCQ